MAPAGGGAGGTRGPRCDCAASQALRAVGQQSRTEEGGKRRRSGWRTQEKSRRVWVTEAEPGPWVASIRGRAAEEGLPGRRGGEGGEGTWKRREGSRRPTSPAGKQ